MTTCPVCDSVLEGRDGTAKDHIVACQKIELGLLAEQLAPTVDQLPAGYEYLPKPWAGRWQG